MMPQLQHDTVPVDVVFPQENDQFLDVVVITARAALVNFAYETAADLIYKHNHSLTLQAVYNVAVSLIRDRKVSIDERVIVTSNAITVLIDVDDINSEEVTWEAIKRVADALDCLNGRQGTVVNSDPLPITIEQVLPLMAELR